MFYTDEIIFIPAVSIATHISVMINDWKLNGKTARFYLKNKSPDEQSFHHPYMLTSAAHNYKKLDFAKRMGINDLSKDVGMLFGDSGGFQIATGAIKGDSDEIINSLYTWLETNATVAPIIDVPPFVTGMLSNIGEADMKGCADKTKLNIKALLDRKKVDTISWLNVSHGRSYEQRNFWYDEVQDFDFYNGWAIGSLRKNNYTILSAFASLMDKGEFEKERCKLIHFFGMSSMRYTPIMIYLKYKLNQKGYKINLSFDSSYATKDCAFGKYLTMMPDSNGFASYHLSNRLIGKFNVNAGLPCTCPVCKNLKLGEVLNENALKAAGQYYFYNVVQSHNVMILCDYINKIQNIIYTDCEYLWKSAFRADYIKTFKVIDQMFEAPKGKSMSVINKFNAFLNKDDEEEGRTGDIEEMFN